MSDYLQIVPKNSSYARGIDICASKKYVYIIRSDLGLYMRTTSINQGSDMEVFKLHDALAWGDGYMLDDKGKWFYIVKGDTIHYCKDLTSDKDGKTKTLLSPYQGGDYYFCGESTFYVLFGSSFRSTDNMYKHSRYDWGSMASAFNDGIYFWCQQSCINCLVQPGEWGPTYTYNYNPVTTGARTGNTISMDVVNFLPGGVAQSNGKSYGNWQLLKSQANDLDSSYDWTYHIGLQAGFNYSVMSSITNSWNINANASMDSGTLTKLLCQFQFSLDVQYGGSKTNTTSADWNVLGTIDSTIEKTIQPGEAVYVWQYQMGFADPKTCLFYDNTVVTDDPNPPEDLSVGNSTVLVGSKL